MSLYALMITQGTHVMSSLVKSLTPSLSSKDYVSICTVRRESKLVRFLKFTMVIEENFKTQTSQNFALLKV